MLGEGEDDPLRLGSLGQSTTRTIHSRSANMKRTRMTLAALLVLGAAAWAQTELPKPALELRKLDMLVGSWTLEGDMKARPNCPAGKMTQNEKCEWMQGGFFLECRSEISSPMGEGVALTMFGYSDDEKTYTWRNFDGVGEFQDSRGRLEGDTWVWSSGETKMLKMSTKGRYTIKITSPTSYDYMFDMSQDGKSWTRVLDGKATKTKFPAF
jgi:Protein of unknown function (DUF1579)